MRDSPSHSMTVFLVPLQNAVLVCTEGAHVALKWPLSRVAVTMPFEYRGGAENLATNMTGVALPGTLPST